MKMSRRELTALGVGVATLGTQAQAAEAARPEPVDPLKYLAPEYRPFLPILRQATALSPLTDQNLEARRKAQADAPFLASPSVLERSVPGPRGAPNVRVFVINAGLPGPPRPAILHIHGGGFVAGTARGAVAGQQHLAADLDCVIVTVDYRLAPETRFPGSLEDNYAALKWLYANAAELGVDKTRIAVVGESAGGGHAAILAIAARDRGEVPLIYQALTFPMLDDRTASTRRVAPWLGSFVWTPGDNRYGWSALLGFPAGSRTPPNGAVPARVDSLRGLPPAFIGVGTLDLFLDEDIDYAHRLLAAGVPTELHVVPGAFHGFTVAPTPLSARFNAAHAAALKTALHPARG